MEDEHNHEHNHENPFANLDEETQAKIGELQMLEQQFQQLLMQKNAFSMESNETILIVREVEKADGEVMRIIGNQVAIKSTKEKILEDMKRKKELIDARLKTIDEQEKEMSEKIESLREEIMKKIRG
ncbi:MAG: prefoldin subunit [Candidatus Pacearchaeota archaeon]